MTYHYLLSMGMIIFTSGFGRSLFGKRIVIGRYLVGSIAMTT